jgi:hypothetical protein
MRLYPEAGCRDIALAGSQRRQQLTPSDRNEHHPHLEMLLLQLPFLGQLLVQILLKDAKYVGDPAPLDALVYKIKSLAVPV